MIIENGVYYYKGYMNSEIVVPLNVNKTFDSFHDCVSIKCIYIDGDEVMEDERYYYKILKGRYLSNDIENKMVFTGTKKTEKEMFEVFFDAIENNKTLTRHDFMNNHISDMDVNSLYAEEWHRHREK